MATAVHLKAVPNPIIAAEHVPKLYTCILTVPQEPPTKPTVMIP